MRFERRKGLGVAKKVGNANQQVAKQSVNLGRCFLQVLDIRLQVANLVYCHAPLDAPVQGARLVQGQIVARAAAQQHDDPLKVALFADAGTIWGYKGRTNFTTWNDQFLYGSDPVTGPAFAATGCVPAYSGPWFGPGSCLNVGGDTKKIRASVGASILWDSPMGPIRFDFAKALSKSPYDQTQFFRFSGGASF